MSTLMPIFLLYLGGSFVYTCTVHWTVQLSSEQAELASVHSLYSVEILCTDGRKEEEEH